MSGKAQQNGYAEYDERHTDENHPYDGSGFAPRTCTDLLCLVIFACYMAGMVGITAYAFQSGNPHRLTHGFNWKGELCGVDTGVEDKPLIYWCGAGTVHQNGVPSNLDVKFPTCVASCPKDTMTEMSCLGVEQVQLDTSGKPPFVTQKTIITQSTTKQMSYPTMELGGAYCIPHLSDLDLPGDEHLTQSLMNPSGALGNSWAKLTTEMGGLRRCWVLVACSMIGAVALGYAYLFMLQFHPKPLVEVVLFLLTIGLLLTGGFFLLGDLLSGNAMEWWETSNLIFRQYDMSTARIVSRLTGLAFTAVGLVMLCCVCFAHDAIQAALGCVEVACECIFTMPSMLLLPLIESLLKLGLALLLICGLAWLLSTADMQPDFIKLKDEEVGGLTRSLQFSTENKVMVAYYVFGMFWILELANAMSQFMISYSVVLWYYTPKPKGFGPHIPLVRGFIVGVVFHLGTLALGAVLIAICRPVRTLLGFISRQAKSGNQLGETIAQCMGCLITCFQKYVEFINKNAYIDVCISSTSFCTAAKNSFGFIASEGGSVLALTGSCFIFCMVGVLGIAAAIAELTYILVTTNERWTSDTSPHYVANPYFVSAVAGALAGNVAICFMVTFDHTADTLLYTYVWNKSHGHNTVQKYAPDTLASLTDYKPIVKPKRTAPSSNGRESRFSVLSSFFSSQARVSPEEGQSLMRTR